MLQEVYDFCMKKKGQVWVETVTYTLIAFVMIGLVLSFAKPKIEELQDKAIIDQSIKMIKDIDSVLQDVGEGAIGNKRKVEISLKKGSLEVSPPNNTFIFELQGKYVYSQIGEDYKEGNLVIRTEETGKYNPVSIKSNYTKRYNLTYQNGNERKIITKSPTPYNLFITNKGGSPRVLDIEIE
ncbi:hypothetical protein HOD29_01950 [archaeon]|jgi:hypothetical protein|nr:hypothetical protein [archaeon]